MSRKNSGRKPLPDNVKYLKGTAQPCRINDEAPTPEADKVECPEYLSNAAKKHWEKISTELMDCGILTNIDVDALAVYCENYATWAEATKKLNRYGSVIKNKQGLPVLSPYFKVARNAFDQMKVLLSEFGMTPSSRTKVKATQKEKPKDDWSDI